MWLVGLAVPFLPLVCHELAPEIVFQAGPRWMCPDWDHMDDQSNIEAALDVLCSL
jgi:hypothetical protein